MTATTTGDENKQIVRRFFEEVVTGGNLNLIDELFTEDVIDHTPAGVTHGREAVKELMESLQTAFTDSVVTVEDVIAEGDTVAMRLGYRGTHEGEFMGLEPTDRDFDIEGMVFTRIRDGKIAERWQRSDMLGLMQQVGIEDMAGE